MSELSPIFGSCSFPLTVTAFRMSPISRVVTEVGHIHVLPVGGDRYPPGFLSHGDRLLGGRVLGEVDHPKGATAGSLEAT